MGGGESMLWIMFLACVVFNVTERLARRRCPCV